MVMESAQKESNDLQQTTSQSAATLHAVRGSNTRSGQLKTTLCLGRIASCYHCGGQHKTSDCCFKNEKCRYCGKKGHIVQVCCRAQRRPVSGASSLDARNICTEDSPMEATANPVYEMFPLTSPKPDPLMVFVWVNQVELHMEIDTGASISNQSVKRLTCPHGLMSYAHILYSLKLVCTPILVKCCIDWGCINVSIFYRGQKE